MGHILVLPGDEINDDDPAGTQVHEETRDADDEEQDEDDSTLPEGEDN
jgi:hypothetical protein